MSYPQALEKATTLYFSDTSISDILKGANNILAIEYLKAIQRLDIKATPIILKREYGIEDDISKITKGITSGANVRKLINANAKYNFTVPFETFEAIEESKKDSSIVSSLKPYENIILYTIRGMALEDLANISDVTEGLENKIKEAAFLSTSIEELIKNIKSKRYTEARIKRVLLHILLNISKNDIIDAFDINPYIRILGFTSKGKDLLPLISKNTNNVCTSVKTYVDILYNDVKNKAASDNEINIEANDNINNNAENIKRLNMFMKDIYATNVYNLGISKNANVDFTNKLIEIERD